THIERTVGLHRRQDRLVNLILSHRLLQVAHGGQADETLDLHGDLPPCFLGAECRSLRAEVDVDILIAVLNPQRIIGDRPAVRREGLNDGIVINVPGRHRLLTNERSGRAVPRAPAPLDDYTIRIESGGNLPAQLTGPSRQDMTLD